MANPRIAAVVKTYKALTETQRMEVCAEAIKLLGQDLCEQVVSAMELAAQRVISRQMDRK